MPLWFRRSPLAKCRACSGTPPDRGRGQGPVTRMLCWFPVLSFVTGAILRKRQPGRRVELALSGLLCSLLGFCCVCQATFEDPFEEDGGLCVFVGLVFPVVACQLCFVGASGWRGGTILREGLSCHSCFACLYTWRLLKTSLSRKRTGSCALIALVVSSFPVGQVPRLFRHTTRSRKRPGPCD